MNRCAITILLALIGMGAECVLAQHYPTRAIRLIAPTSTGGSSDILSRMVAAKLSERLGQHVVVDNRPGASGIIGIDLVIKSQPDGYTLLMGAGSFGALNSFYPKAPFDVARDLAPIAFIGGSPYVLVVPPSMPVKTVAELIVYAKARPGMLNYAASTPAAPQHLAGELFKRAAGVDMFYVPYKGIGTVMPDLLGGRLNAAFDNVLVLVPHIRNGALRGLGVTSAQRSAVIPELPTIAESGVPGFQKVGWFGVFAAAKTPLPIVRQLNAEIVGIMKTSEIGGRLLAQGVEPIFGSPDDLRKHLAREIEVSSKLIREAGLKLE